MHSWLKRTQLVQRPSSEASKPEHRILRLRQYRQAIAVLCLGAGCG
jgi:hypothetical protein